MLPFLHPRSRGHGNRRREQDCGVWEAETGVQPDSQIVSPDLLNPGHLVASSFPAPVEEGIGKKGHADNHVWPVGFLFLCLLQLPNIDGDFLWPGAAGEGRRQFAGTSGRDRRSQGIAGH